MGPRVHLLECVEGRRAVESRILHRRVEPPARVSRADRLRHRRVRGAPDHRADHARAALARRGPVVRRRRARSRFPAGRRPGLDLRHQCRPPRALTSRRAGGLVEGRASRGLARRHRSPRRSARRPVLLRPARCRPGDGRGRGQGRFGRDLHRGAALRQHERRPGERVFLRRHHRGIDQRAGKRRRLAGGLPHRGLCAQGQEPRHPADRRRAERRHLSRRQHPAGGQRAAGDRAAHQRKRRVSPLVEELRPGAEGRLRAGGRDRAVDRAGAAAQAGEERRRDAADHEPRGA